MSDTAGRNRTVPHPILVSLALFVAVLAALSAAVRQIPIDAFRHRIEAAFERATGRELRIGGPIRLALLPVPGLVADDVSVANLPGGSRPVMAHVRRLEADIDLAALVVGNVRVVGLTLADPDILLERLPDGTPNWRFAPPRRAGSAARSDGAARHRFRFSVVTVDGNGGTLTWSDRGGLGTGQVGLSTFHAGVHRREDPFTLYVSGRHGSAPFVVSLASARLDALPLEPEAGTAAPFPVRASAAFGSGDAAARVSIDGSFADPLRLRGFAGGLHASIPSLGALDALLPNADLPPATDIELQARLGLDGAGHEIVERLALSGSAADLRRWKPGLLLARFAIGAEAPDGPVSLDVAGSLGPDPFTIDAPSAGTLALWQGLAGGTAPLTASVSSGRDRVSLVGKIGRDTGAPAGNQPVGGRIDAAVDVSAPDPSRLGRLAGGSLPWHRPIDLSGRLRLDGTFRSATGGGNTGHGSLDAARWTLDGSAMPPARADIDRAADGVVTAHFAIPSAGTGPFLVWTEDTGRHPSPVVIALDGKQLPAAALAFALLDRTGLDGRLDATGRLTGTATGLEIDPASLAGPLSATVENARVDASLGRAWLDPLFAAARVPGLRVGSRTIRCAGVTGRFDGGTLHASALSLDDPSLLLQGSGTINFVARTLDLALHPTLRLGGIGASAPVTLAGSFDAPRAALSPDSAGRFTLSIGRPATDAVACDAAPDLGPAPPAGKPRALDILRGLFR